jgi:RND superfamily putative drug exporter
MRHAVTRLTDWVLSHGRLVVLLWVALTVAGAGAASQISGALSQSFSAPGREGFDANQEIAERFGAGGATSPVVLVAREETSDPEAAFERVADAIPQSRLLEPQEADGTSFAVVAVPLAPNGADENPEAVASARGASRGEVLVTGVDALAEGSSDGGPGLLVETLLGGLGALAVLAFVFASLLALVPLLVAAVSILTTFLLLLGLTEITEVSFVVQFLVALIGLGVAIDYSLLLVVRWREERDRGATGEEAIRRAMETSGAAVAFSGTTVAIGLLALVVVPVPFIRSIGFGGLLIPLVSVLASLTLLPVLLRRFGDRLAWPRRRREEQASRGWTRWSRAVVRRPLPAAVAGLAVLVALLVAATGLRPGDPDLDALASSGEARDALVELERVNADGALRPIEIVAPSARAEGAVSDVEGVRTVLTEQAGGRTLITALPHIDTATEEGGELLDRVRETAHEADPQAQVGGETAQTQDLTDAIYGSFPAMIALIALTTFVLLARAFRSVLLPLKAIALNVVSVGAAFGVVVLVWQDGHGSEAIWGLPATGAVTAWIPLAIFAFLYGLSMDYEVFILARVREEYDRTGSTEEAVVGGLGRTGRLVTSAALILFLAFVALGASPGTEIKVLATGLAAGILLDATVVRALVVPALVVMFGRANWWMPPWLARLLRVP